MERTLIILKPSAIERELAGEIISRLERKGLYFAGLKMMWLTDEIVDEHYTHLKGKSFFEALKQSMQASPVIVCCVEGKDAVEVVRNICGATNGRNALPGTIRGDYSISVMENIIHASDSVEAAKAELNRFFKPEELFDYNPATIRFRYEEGEMD